MKITNIYNKEGDYMMNRKIRDYKEEELRRRAASDEELNI